MADQPNLHGAIMNIPCATPEEMDPCDALAYRMGHRDARHAAAELVLEPLAALTTERETLKAARAYGEARRVQLHHRRLYSAYRCDFRDDDTASCYLCADAPLPDWCESCRNRHQPYTEWRAALRREKAALKVVQKLLEKQHTLALAAQPETGATP